jgi:hypothetical protein
MTFTLPDRTLTYNNSLFLLLDSNQDGTQTYRLTMYDNDYRNATLNFNGAGLFTDSNPSTLNPSAINLSTTYAGLQQDRSFGGGRVVLDSLNINGFTVSAPVPATWALLMPGLAWMMWGAYRRRSV